MYLGLSFPEIKDCIYRIAKRIAPPTKQKIGCMILISNFVVAR